jgi:hypothetical protein
VPSIVAALVRLTPRDRAAVDLEAAEDAYRQARAELERARSSAVKRGPLLSTGDGYALPAPADGEVVSRTVNPGDHVEDATAGGANAPRALFVIRPSGETCNPDP